MPAGDVFGLDGFFLNVSNPITVSVVDINTASSSAGIAITGGSFSSGTVTLNLSNAAGLTTTPFYTGAIVGVSSISQAGIAHTAYNGTFVVTGFAGTTTVSYATTGYDGPVTASIGATTIGYIQLLTDTAVTNTTWSSAQTHGWFGGGATPTTVSTVDRIDFSNDTGTANIRGPLSQANASLAATGNSNYGWFGGGTASEPSTSVSTVDRIDFSNDSSTVRSRGQLNPIRSAGATGNSNYGWFAGGLRSPSPVLSAVNRIDFSNDSATALQRGPLSAIKGSAGATGNSNYGWFGGGGPGFTATVDRIDFSNDSSTASPRGPLSLARTSVAATGNSNYGWFGGGGVPAVTATVDRIDFSNDSSTASVRGPLSLARNQLAATGNSNYGWFGGGFIPGPAFVSTVDRIDFSNDSVTASSRGPSTLNFGAGRAGASATSGQARSSSVRLQKAGNYGWFGGQFNIPTPGRVSTVDRINFSNDLAAVSPRGPISSARDSVSATGNSNYGWFGGGTPGTLGVSTVDRIDFSNDSVPASIRGPLSAIKYGSGVTGNFNYGWWAGGTIQPSPSLPPVYYSSTDRINFSNDSVTSLPRAILNAPGGISFMGATGNSNYGWFAGGFTNTPTPATFSKVDRIDFSNDSIQPSPRAILTITSSSLAATGNSNYGWFAGAPNPISTVNRIDFSNDSTTASIRGPLFSAKSRLGATGNSNYGLWAGGSTGAAPFVTYSRVDRIDFANDLATASVRGPLSAAKYLRGATSNSTR
jgi:hypothetical protein